jgi:hydroxyethylthiazole kinase-like uncharacterized protein yjeF
LVDQVGRVTGSTVVLLVGSGNNGGDGFWAGAWLAGRGARVLAIPVADSMHQQGLQALIAAGGRVIAAVDAADAIGSADLIVDAIVGIGGRGGLREPAASLVAQCVEAGQLIVACDIASGVDADTGSVRGSAVVADVTVTFGALKPGLMLMPGADYAGIVELVDIGLDPWLPESPEINVVQASDVAELLPPPAPEDHKYSRGVVTIDAGSPAYPGAGVLVTGAARYGGVGLVQQTATTSIPIEVRFPDVVLGEPITDRRVTALVTGPGLDGERPSADRLRCEHPVVIDAYALRRIASDSALAQVVRERATRGLVTVLTPHEGEFAALMPGVEGDLLERTRKAAAHWNCVVLLKGATTVVCAPSGAAWSVALAPADLATAGSGDILAGLIGSMLAADEARHRARGEVVGPDLAALIAAGAAWLHALAARIAVGAQAKPVTADDIVLALPNAIATVRAGEVSS